MATPPRSPSLRGRLAIAFAGIAVLTAAVIGTVLVPVLSSHYATAEEAYLATGAERAVRDLVAVDWTSRGAMSQIVGNLALVTQARVTVVDASGAIVAVAGPPTGATPPGGPQSLANPLGTTFLGGAADPASLPRSTLSITLPVRRQDSAATADLGSVTIDLAPDYPTAAFAGIVEAWALASLIGVLAAALAGLLVARWLTRPLATLTAASERMATGDLGARADVVRADEVGRLAVAFNGMADRTEETVTALRRFIADAAHEIGTPLTALRADLELAEARAATDDERRLVRRAVAQADRLGALAAGLLRLARLETRANADVRVAVDLVPLLRTLADAYASRVDQAGLELAVAIPVASARVTGDPDRLRTAIAYLLDNACKFTPEGGTVTLGLTAADGVARVRVADTGIGIPPEDVPALFERFHRGRNAAAYPGSGLGLAIVRVTAELHGGTVRLVGGQTGATFELSLPLA